MLITAVDQQFNLSYWSMPQRNLFSTTTTVQAKVVYKSLDNMDHAGARTDKNHGRSL